MTLIKLIVTDKYYNLCETLREHSCFKELVIIHISRRCTQIEERWVAPIKFL